MEPESSMLTDLYETRDFDMHESTRLRLHVFVSFTPFWVECLSLFIFRQGYVYQVVSLLLTIYSVLC